MNKQVSVVMAVHNGLPYLSDAVESILAQSWEDLEFIIIDDASTDESIKVLSQFADERIRIIQNAKRGGLAKSLNSGIDTSKGDYIARMDADDVSLPKRLERQITFMQTRPELDICGTWARTIGHKPEQLWQYPDADAYIKAEMLFASVLVHSSVMLRRDSVLAHDIRYNEKLEAAQDYELWTRMMDKLVFANVPELLLEYRLHSDQVGVRQGDKQQEVADDVRIKLLEKIGVDASQIEIDLHQAIARWDFGGSYANLDAIESWLIKLKEANELSSLFLEDALGQALEQRWWAACRTQIHLGTEAWRTYQSSPIAVLGNRTLRDKATFFAKSVSRSLGFGQ